MLLVGRTTVTLLMLSGFALPGSAAASGLALQTGPQAPVPADSPAAQPSVPAPKNAGAADRLRPLCTDRPTKSSGACTVDAGHFQYESDIVNASYLRQGGVRMDTYLIPNPTLKYGLTGNTDVELNVAPYETVRTRDRNLGVRSRVSGIGDLYGRVKVNLVGNDSGALAVALYPYLKAPTARRGIGNRAWEGGLLVPATLKLSPKWSLSFTPEFDALEDNLGNGRHFNTAQLVNVGLSLPRNVTVFGELWADYDFDPSGTVKQYSADIAAAWGLTDNLQLDAGLNFGLNKQTPGVQAYVGISQRF